MEIFKEFVFESAHRLPNVPEDHPCHRLHGHSYRVAVHVEGKLGPDTGWVQDFGDIGTAFGPLRQVLDHRYLNDVPGLENPTSEQLAMWIWDRMRVDLPGLSQVTVRETATSGCTFRGD
jgi:6-pyruvoyltetrahydropterin/6-carboxytetrahydropterin synthase